MHLATSGSQAREVMKRNLGLFAAVAATFFAASVYAEASPAGRGGTYVSSRRKIRKRRAATRRSTRSRIPNMSWTARAMSKMARGSRSTTSARSCELTAPGASQHGWLHFSVVVAAARPLSSLHPRQSLPNEKRTDPRRRSGVVVRRGPGCGPTAKRCPAPRVKLTSPSSARAFSPEAAASSVA